MITFGQPNCGCEYGDGGDWEMEMQTRRVWDDSSAASRLFRNFPRMTVGVYGFYTSGGIEVFGRLLRGCLGAMM